MGLAVLLSGGLVISGFLAGFLFGIPRAPRDWRPKIANGSRSQINGNGNDRTSTNSGIYVSRGYVVNSSLEEISEWLMKIIVGLGLAEDRKVLSQLTIFINFIGDAQIAGQGGKIYAFALFTFFAPLGFLGGYLYTRSFLTRLFTISESGTPAQGSGGS